MVLGDQLSHSNPALDGVDRVLIAGIDSNELAAVRSRARAGRAELGR